MSCEQIRATIDVPSDDNNKESQEFFFNLKIADYPRYYEAAHSNIENNSPNIANNVENLTNTTTEYVDLPPNSAISCPAKMNRCSKIKNRRIKKPVTFDNIIGSLNYNVLYLNFSKLLNFLESKNRELSFPFISKYYEEVFKMIVQDANVLKSKSLDVDYREISDKILETLVANKTVYILACGYEYRKDFRDILIMKKVYLKNEPGENVTPPLSGSLESLPQSEFSSDEDPDELLKRSHSLDPLSNGFKKHCLETALEFVKNKITKKIEFPELSLEQAKFMRLILESVVAFAEFDKNIEIKELYTALWEAVKIYSLSYEFKIKTVQTCGENKSLVFEKIPKEVPEEPAAPVSKLPEPPKTMYSVPPIQMMNPYVPIQIPVYYGSQKNPSKKTMKKQRKAEKHLLMMNYLPKTFLIDTLNTIIAFVLDNEQLEMTLIPRVVEQETFFRKVLIVSRCPRSVTAIGGELKPLLERLKTLATPVKLQVVKPKNSKINAETGLKDVTFVKKAKMGPPSAASQQQKSANKKKKINLQKILPLGNIDRLSDNDINMLSDKKPSKPDQRPDSDDSSSDEDSDSRPTSLDRKPVVAKPQTASRPLPTSTAFGARMNAWARQADEMSRKDKLMQALSVPVKIDKAMKMMQSMGWSGGALGARGNGITEPIMPALDRPCGAGLGHKKAANPSFASTSQFSNTGSNRAANLLKKEFQNESTKNNFQKVSSKSIDVQNKSTVKNNVDKTTDNTDIRSSGTAEKAMSSEIATEPEKTASKIAENEAPFSSNTAPNWLSQNTNTFPESIDSHTSTPTDIIVTKTNLLLESNFSFDNLMGKNAKEQQSVMEYPHKFRTKLLQYILNLLRSKENVQYLRYTHGLSKRDRHFIRQILEMSAITVRTLLLEDELEVYEEICVFYGENPGVVVKVCVSQDNTKIVLRKVRTYTPDQVKHLTGKKISPEFKNWNPISSIKTDTEMTAFIDTLDVVFQTEKPYTTYWFRCLILLKILHFLKTNDEELELVFNKLLSSKLRAAVEVITDGVNSRSKFTNTTAETALVFEIHKHIKDAYLGVMFNHHFTAFTLSKYFRFKRLNRPDEALKKKRRSATVYVNLEDFIFSQEISDQQNDNITKTTQVSSTNIDKNISAKSWEATENSNFVDDNDNQVLDIRKGDHIIDKDINFGEEVEYIVWADCKEIRIDTNSDDSDIDKSDNDLDKSDDFTKDVDNDDFAKDDEFTKDVVVDDWANIASDASFTYNDDENVHQNATTISNKESKVIPDTNIDVKTDVEEREDFIEQVKETDNKSFEIDKNDPLVEDNTIEKIENIINEKSKKYGNKIPFIDDVEDKTDCDLQENLGLGENCDNLPLNEYTETDKIIEIKNVYLVPLKYPEENITREKAKEIQKLIIDDIFKTKQLPLLMCHGVQNGALIYTCHDKKSFDWIKETVSVANDLKVLDVNNVNRMALKLYCLCDFDVNLLFSLIEMYNKDLSTKEWVIERSEFYDDCAVFEVKMDQFSVNYIHSHDLALFAGVDKVEFSLIWD